MPPSEIVYFFILCSLHHTDYTIKSKTVDGNQIWRKKMISIAKIEKDNQQRTFSQHKYCIIFGWRND